MFPMLYAVRNRLLTCWKTMARMIRPRIDGRAPGSPVRSLMIQPLNASPIERSSTSREKASDRSPAGVLSEDTLVSGVLVDIARPLDALVGGGRRQADVPAATGGDELDDLGGAGVLLLH